MAPADVALGRIAFGELPGWEADDHLAAFQAFARSAHVLVRSSSADLPTRTQTADRALVRAAALALASPVRDAGAARTFFETNFAPHRIRHTGAEGLLTGYYEPVLAGRRRPEAAFRIPIYRRPPDLVALVREEERGALADRLTHARRTEAGVAPYPTRAEIENGALAGQNLELVWLADAIDAFFLHVQGSGRIHLPDGKTIRISYDGKNGHPYTSIGRALIEAGQIMPEAMTLDTLRHWLAADPERARQAMQQNRSYIFFRELKEEADGPLGAQSIPLSEGRSLAVDTAYHALGTPIYVSAPTLDFMSSPGAPGFARLMIAQDVGSAIRGPERGDLYCGSGAEAGARAGIMKHPGSFAVLVAQGGGSLP